MLSSTGGTPGMSQRQRPNVPGERGQQHQLRTLDCDVALLQGWYQVAVIIDDLHNISRRRESCARLTSGKHTQWEQVTAVRAHGARFDWQTLIIGNDGR